MANEWDEVRALDDSGKTEEALRVLLTHPKQTASYYYNLGTVQQKLGRPGSAVAFLEKANRLKPYDPATQNNLKLARESLSQLVGTERLDPASSWLESVADRVSLDEVRGGTGLVGFILVLIWLRTYAKTRDFTRTILQPVGYFAVLGFAITLGLYAMGRYAEGHPPAVLTEREVVRSGPGDRYLELGRAEAGTKVRLLGPTSEEAAEAPAPAASPVSLPVASDPTPSTPHLWRQVRFSEDGIGWVRASSLLLL